MSDKYLSKIMSEFGALKDRISELEKKIENNQEWRSIFSKNVCNEHQKEILELKKDIGALEKLFRVHDQMIAELREKMDKVENYYENALTEHERHVAEDLIEPKFNELKSLVIDNHRTAILYCDELKEDMLTTVLEVQKNKKVLLEFIDFQYHLYTMNPKQFGDSDKFERWLEKLDGVGSARQTVKRCKHFYEIRGEFEVCTICGYISPKRIDSGGEKELVGSNKSTVKVEDIPDSNSKPPEPKCRICGSTMVMDISTLNQESWWCQTCFPRIPIEPRENDSHALDALLHAVAPIPLPEVNKLIKEAKKELISEFVEKLKIMRSGHEIYPMGEEMLEELNDLIKEYEEREK